MSGGTYAQGGVAAAVLHGVFGVHGFVAADHLDEGVALLPVDDAGLHDAELVKDAAQLGLGASGDVRLSPLLDMLDEKGILT